MDQFSQFSEFEISFQHCLNQLQGMSDEKKQQLTDAPNIFYTDTTVSIIIIAPKITFTKTSIKFIRQF